MTSTPFKLIHVDLWGPHRVSDMTRATYFLTIVDDCTGCTWEYLMQNKMQHPHMSRNSLHMSKIISKERFNTLEVTIGLSSFKISVQTCLEDMALNIEPSY